MNIFFSAKFATSLLAVLDPHARKEHIKTNHISCFGINRLLEVKHFYLYLEEVCL